MIWTESDIETLKRLWLVDGKSGAEIAAAMGRTRNAVVRRLHRLNLNGHGAYRQGSKAPGMKARPKRERTTPPPGLSILDLRPCQCRFPFGTGPYTFCGAPTREDRSYCDEHHALTHMPGGQSQVDGLMRKVKPLGISKTLLVGA